MCWDFDTIIQNASNLKLLPHNRGMSAKYLQPPAHNGSKMLQSSLSTLHYQPQTSVATKNPEFIPNILRLQNSSSWRLWSSQRLFTASKKLLVFFLYEGFSNPCYSNNPCQESAFCFTVPREDDSTASQCGCPNGMVLNPDYISYFGKSRNSCAWLVLDNHKPALKELSRGTFFIYFPYS